tara:strand:+ start:1532 stop:2440 length:909 start_codon:yes stop_codon:yes gene_type:complete
MNIVIEKNKKILNDTYYNYLYQSSERLNYIYKKVLNICSKEGKILDVLEIGSIPYLLTNVLCDHENINLTTINHPSVYAGDYFIEQLSNLFSFEKSDKKYRYKVKSKKFSDNRFYEYRLDICEKITEDLGQFDLVICTEVFEHIPNPPFQGYLNLNNLLKKDGILIFSVPNALNFGKVSDIFWGKSSFDMYKDNIYDRHHHEYSIFQIRDVMKNYGFKIIEENIVSFKKFLPDYKIQTKKNNVQTIDEKPPRASIITRIILKLLKLSVWNKEAHNGKIINIIASKTEHIKEKVLVKSIYKKV